jgi:hypothetical protein
MSRNIIFLVISIFAVPTFGQSFNPEVISSGGDSYSQINGKMDVTIGETITDTQLENSTYLTQGFQQGNLFVSQIEENSIVNSFSINVFPNPAINEISISSDAEEPMSVYLYDLNGKLLLSETMNMTLILDFSSYAAGSYFLKLTTGNTISTYIIQKVK